MKYLKVIKRGLSKIVLVSEDGEKWLPLETAYDLDGNFEMEFFSFDGENLGTVLK